MATWHWITTRPDGPTRMPRLYHRWGAGPAQPGMYCPSCDSPDVLAVSRAYYTGVTAPDGAREERLSEGIKCLTCGAYEEL